MAATPATFLDPLFSAEESVLRRHKVPNQALVWQRALPPSLDEVVRRLTREEKYGRFLKRIHDFWTKVELKDGELRFVKNSRTRGVKGWNTGAVLRNLFGSQDAAPLAEDLEARLRSGFEIFSSSRLNLRIFTQVARYGLIKPAKFHTDTIYVMGLNYAAPCTEIAFAPTLQPVLSLPEGSVSIIPPGQIHRSPARRSGGNRLYAAIFSA